MNTITFDTHKIVAQLQARGFSKDQAEGVIDVLVDNEFVTKVGLESHTDRIITEMHKQRGDLMKWITGVLVAQSAAIVALQNLIG